MKAGYTLVELLIVTAIIGLLSSISIPPLSRFYFNVQSVTVEAELATIQTGISMYVGEYNSYPTSIEQLTKYVQVGGLIDKYEINPNLNGGI